MNFSLLDKIESIPDGFVATLVATEGHTYRKAGAKALFRVDDPFPVQGNLGALCADQEIVSQGSAAMRERVPRLIHIDTTSENDALLGYGTLCGGVMEILLEPIREDHREVFRVLRARLEAGRAAYLAHHIDDGAIELYDDRPADRAGVYVERIDPPRRVVIYGATPLAACIHAALAEAPYDVHVVDPRAAYLERLESVAPSRRHEGSVALDAHTRVLIVSHSFTRDKAALAAALEAQCPYVGLLSSKSRRDRMYEELVSEGVERAALDRVSSPVGLFRGGSTDGEIAVSIVAELMNAEEA